MTDKPSGSAPTVSAPEPFFEFEKPIATLEKKLHDLKDLARQEKIDFKSEINTLEGKVSRLIDDTYSKLSPWQKVQLSRHPSRPYTRDYIDQLFPDFMELCGDRAYGDDQAILGGTATWTSSSGTKSPFLILGHQKGRTTKQKMERNFAMAKPEGYRKAIRLMELANRSRMPILTFIDTPGAYPGIDAEERGQSQAIAEAIECMFRIEVPIVCVVIGEGGSGGALAIGIGNKILMQEYSVYSVISPESCASILWNDSGLAERAAEKLKMSPVELLKFGVIDDIISEPKGGAHRSLEQSSQLLKAKLTEAFGPYFEKSTAHHSKLDTPNYREERIQKFRIMGNFAITQAPLSAPPSGSNHVIFSENSKGHPKESQKTKRKPSE